MEVNMNLFLKQVNKCLERYENIFVIALEEGFRGIFCFCAMLPGFSTDKNI